MAVFVNGCSDVPQLGIPLSDLEVGSIVKLNMSGEPKEFIVVHHGLPSSVYDSSCDGTWLLMKDLHTQMSWGASNNDYEASTVHTYLNGTFFYSFDAEIQSIIKQIKIPYHKGKGNAGSVTSGSNGLSTKVFLLSGNEIGWESSDFPYGDKHSVIGACLSYFSDPNTDTVRRGAYYNGTNAVWWTRSPDTESSGYAAGVASNGTGDDYNCTYSQYVRPSLIALSDTLCYENEDDTYSVKEVK